MAWLRDLLDCETGHGGVMLLDDAGWLPNAMRYVPPVEQQQEDAA